MPSTKNDVAVYLADSDALAGLIAVQSELYCSTHCKRLSYTGAFPSREILNQGRTSFENQLTIYIKMFSSGL